MTLILTDDDDTPGEFEDVLLNENFEAQPEEIVGASASPATIIGI